MITSEQVSERARRSYPALLRQWLAGEPFEPLSVPAGALPTEYRALQRAVEHLLGLAKDRRGYGYRVESETRATRAFGTQSLPVRIVIDTPDDLLQLVNKREEFTAFQNDVGLIRAALPQLEAWLALNTQQVIAHHGVWPELLEVCDYFLTYPRAGHYVRELPIPVHTKFIEEHTGVLRRLLDALLPPDAIDWGAAQFESRYGLRYDEPTVRIRLLDARLMARLALPLSDISAPISQIAALPFNCQDCVIVENKLVFLTLPALPNALAIFGGGFRVDLLKQLPWLHACRLWYWGDLDAQGFQILARLRSHFPLIVSVLMDEVTLTTFRAFAVPGTPCPPTVPQNLTATEQAVFTQLVSTTMRLEQERIDYGYAQRALQEALGHSAEVIGYE
jgi:hypothetical protein